MNTVGDISISVIAIYYQTSDGIVHKYNKVIEGDGIITQLPLCNFVSINENNREFRLSTTLIIEQDNNRFSIELTGSANVETKELAIHMVAEKDSNIKTLGYDINLQYVS